MKKIPLVILAVLSILFILVFAQSEGDYIKRDIAFETQKIQILKCESSYRHYGVWGDNGRAYGIAQFHRKTFDRFKTLAGWPQLRWDSLRDQLWLFDWALRNGYANAWTCARCLPAKTKVKPAFKIASSSKLSASSKYCKSCNYSGATNVKKTVNKVVKKVKLPVYPTVDRSNYMDILTIDT